MWFIYALLGAVGKSYSGLFRKKIAKNVSGAMFMWVSYTLVLLVMSPFMFASFSEVTSALTSHFLIAFGAALSLMIATQLNLEALKREDLSYTAPLNAFVPVFTYIIAILFLGENPPRFGIAGIILIVLGAYIVSIKPERVKWYDPIKRLFVSAGAQLSIGVAVGYAINTVLMKVLSNNGYSAFVVMYVMTFIGWLLLVYVPVTKRSEFVAISKSDKVGVFGGAASSFFGNFFHILANASTYSSYATSVRRLDAIISVLLGWRYLDEKNIRIKLTGSVIMVIGAITLIIA
jgi:drug/metabolite transporter (DMT)-like permease